MKLINRIRARKGALALVASAALLAGCNTADNLLKVNNPAAIGEGELNDPNLADVLVNSAIGEFQNMYADPFIWRGSMFTDEQVTGINWEQTARLNQRIINYDEGDADVMFRNLQRARAAADTASGRLRQILDSPDTDVRLAKALAYAGYSYILMGETLCGADITQNDELGDKVYTPTELFGFAVTRLNEALTIALASGDNDAPDVANLARVGLARANLNLGNKDEVKKWAAQVPADFKWWVYYSVNSDRENNVMYDRTHGSNRALGVAPKFLIYGTFGEKGQTNQTDPRIQYDPNWRFGHNGLTKLYTPFAPWSYSTYNAATQATGGEPGEFDRDTDIIMASGLEAQHDFAEADGPTAATLAFVNERRAYGNETPVDLSGDALMAELRDQRGRDLYLGGFRLGDLRRWKAQGVGDFFPSGQHPNAQWGNYGDATCFPIPLEEYNANHNLPNPHA